MEIKHHFFTLMLTISTFALIGQEFVNESNEWFVDDCCYASGELSCRTYKYWFNETTIINSVTYFKLNSNSSYPTFEVGEYYREEDGMVYMKLDENDEEVIIYNFNLDVGEQFEIGNSSLNYLLEVLSVDSITLNSGERRKRLEVARASNTNYKAFWIEGVGSESSPMNPLYMFAFDCWNELNCFHEENIVELQLGNCELTSLKSINELSRMISTYPNPVTEEISFIKNDKEQIKQIDIIDLNGRSILHINSPVLQPINLNGISKGIYLAKIIFKNGTIGVSKFVKQ